MPKLGIIVLAIGIVLTLFNTSLCDKRLNRQKRFIEMADDVRGPYCETKPGGPCCPGRDDQCTVPILDSICYCDMFCNITASDCCPDFQRICIGGNPEPITRGCRVNGIEYRVGSVFKNNCNQCTCRRNPSNPNQAELRCTDDVCLVQPDMIQLVNNGNYGWKAANYSFFWGKTLNDGIKYRLGTMPPSDQVLNMNPIIMDSVDQPPQSFDSRQKWPNYIHPVRDQGDCAASWAFSTAAVASDRLAIESEGVLPEELSPQHLISCNVKGQLGCEGGYLDKAWWFLRKNGIVTDSCYPYESGSTNNAGFCKMRKSKNYRNVTCPNSGEELLEKILHSTPPYRIRSNEREIMMEIMKNGPVQAILKVKEDFFMYKSGVYSYSRIQPDNMAHDDKGYHSIRIIGWGVERQSSGVELKYWVCANSWGPSWGENGYFKISRQQNDTKIESFVLAVWGNLWRLKADNIYEIRKLVAQRKKLRLLKEFQNDSGTVRHYNGKLRRLENVLKIEKEKGLLKV
ncbi:uncharacterized peptidase C1-like protein F26E4.3 isoform X1 [Mytilus californianus]|uniref:uncharacterized peptidase C1-like protein F26E4.3 isoform X1 n=1 Tax=Mytilus californianus TaxID=6549 RepID=UPI0022473DC9|nr:uncharacterized peptidase C1-like protein F26E4.3 isoform X1 [Mytilus californianus]